LGLYQSFHELLLLYKLPASMSSPVAFQFPPTK